MANFDMSKMQGTGVEKKISSEPINITEHPIVEVVPRVPNLTNRSVQVKENNAEIIKDGVVTLGKVAMSKVLAGFEIAASVINNLIEADKEIEMSHDQVRIAKIQADAYVAAKKEETSIISIQEREKTERVRIEFQKTIVEQQIELEKFKLEIIDRQNLRTMKQEDYKKLITPYQEMFQMQYNHVSKLLENFEKSGYKDKDMEKMLNYKIEQIYRGLEAMSSISSELM